MSHELEDNIERRRLIIGAVPTEGLTRDDLIEHIMNYGYNERGARSKITELVRLKMLIIKGNKYYPVKTVQREKKE